MVGGDSVESGRGRVTRNGMGVRLPLRKPHIALPGPCVELFQNANSLMRKLRHLHARENGALLREAPHTLLA